MASQVQHDLLVKPTHDEESRQRYISDLRMHVLNRIGAGMHEVYEHSVKPAFERAHGRAPQSGSEVRKAMLNEGYCRSWSTMVRSTQEMLWDSIIPSVERSQPGLNARIRELNEHPALGSLTLDSSVTVPRYVSAVDIHCMPGNYQTEHVPGDASQGALFDRGLFVYQAGAAGPLCDSNGRTIAETIKKRWPDFKPKTILDVGCTIGNNTLPYLDVFPDAELHAIDVATPCLRYGHARAEVLGKPVHFHQMDAEQMSFDDGSFDLVVSCILFHETSHKAVPKIVGECHRVLKSGGLTLHMEGPRTDELNPYYEFYYNWDGMFNNEPFLQKWGIEDMKGIIGKSGFSPDRYLELTVPDFYSTPADEFARAARSAPVKKESTGHWGEDYLFSMYGAWK